MRKIKISLHLLCLLLFLMAAPVYLVAQNEKEALVGVDSLNENNTVKAVPDSSGEAGKKTRIYSPRSAAIRSAILPGLGQIYNKKYWKLPIVYGALGTSAAVFFYNLKNYKDTRFAFKVKYNMRQPNATAADSALFNDIEDILKPLSESSLRSYRDQFRRDIDYSALFFVILWGLNVVDAAVDAHLKAFDVSPDLSLRFKPGRSEMAGTNGLSLVLNIGKNISPPRLLKSRF